MKSIQARLQEILDVQGFVVIVYPGGAKPSIGMAVKKISDKRYAEAEEIAGIIVAHSSLEEWQEQCKRFGFRGKYDGDLECCHFFRMAAE